MKNFIEELYYGNSEPKVRSIKPDAEAQKQMQILAESETKLNALLTNEQKELFVSYANAWRVVNEVSILDSFITGLRMGARFTYNTSESGESPFQKVTE